MGKQAHWSSVGRAWEPFSRWAGCAGLLLTALFLLSACGSESAPREGEDDENTASLSEGLAVAERVFASSDPRATYESLGEPDRIKFDAVTTPTSYEFSTTELDSDAELMSSSARAAFQGCWERHEKGKAKALLGNVLYTFWQTTQVCVRRGRVHRVRVNNADGETSTPGWRIAHKPTTATKNVGWEGRGLARYYFVLGAGGWDIQRPSACLQQRLNANGHDHLTLRHCDLAR